MNQTIKKIIIGLLIIFCIYLAVQFTGIGSYLSLEHITQNAERLELMVEQNYLQTVLIYILLFAFVILLVLPGFPPLTMVGGFLFGMFYGSLYALIGSFLGSIVSFFGIKFLLQKSLEKKYEHRLASFQKSIARSGTANTLLVLHFLTVIPFFIINTLAALSNISTFTFIWTTIVGSIPLLLLYAFAGQQLHAISSVGDIFSGPVILLFIVLLIISISPMIIKKFRKIPEVVEE